MYSPLISLVTEKRRRSRLLLRAEHSEYLVVKLGDLFGAESLGGRRNKRKIFLQQLLQPGRVLDASSHGDPAGQVGHFRLSFLRNKPVVEKNRRMGVLRVLHQRQHVGLGGI